MDELGQCQEIIRVADRWRYQEKRCKNPAKFIMVSTTKERREVCGIHSHMLENRGHWRREAAHA